LGSVSGPDALYLMATPPSRRTGQRKPNMNTTHTLNRIIAGALLSGGLGLAGLGLGAGTAQAVTGPYQWCPGQPLPATGLVWDMNRCHTYYKVGYGQGNVA